MANLEKHGMAAQAPSQREHISKKLINHMENLEAKANEIRFFVRHAIADIHYAFQAEIMGINDIINYQ